ncbi:hypothetical protein GU926_12970 [Nibribacter ruber]|uniref:Uncharacterized protein n=1 Tax=Nibribacter ruber TaxID=2698458 RepID=A0A6P1P0B4_9BACT|nr:hypothetical protein [Nibribacter ruber]QHL88294.1 hypothetical protein GU926_12970 [Nibribacter ruber]
MKGALKAILYIFLVILSIGVLFAAVLIADNKDKEEKLSEVAHIVIGLGEKINDLESADLIICDSTYNYLNSSLKDTIGENVGIPNSKSPCAVFIRYNFKSGKSKVLEADSLYGLDKLSGATSFYLFKDSVKVAYHD